ncbi:phosphoribosylanthranilate isomerase [Gloeocapsa sp. PCC 73106]|nr:phosphoribosylanthranilate isomerase [Gloeocapsa sp. PCC 73106]
MILAGGLNPNNVSTSAIQIVKPFGVDVNSGVKNFTGFKDSRKVLDFIYNAKIESFKIQNTRIEK